VSAFTTSIVHGSSIGPASYVLITWQWKQ